MEEAKLIDISEWEQFGEGGVGQSYNHRSNKEIILKMNKEGWPMERTYNEFRKSKEVQKTGLSVPLTYDFVTDGKRYGYTSQRLTNKKSYSRIIAADKAGMAKHAAHFAQLTRQLHSTPCNTEVFDCPLTIYMQMIDKCDAIPQDAREILHKFYKEHDLEATTCIHGDLQMGNLLLADGKDYWIDLGGFGYADPYADLANMYLLGYILPAQMIPELFHISRRTFRKFFKLFLEEYFQGSMDKAKWERIKHAALLRAGVCIAAKPESAPLFLPAIRGRRLQFALVSFLARFVKASV